MFHNQYNDDNNDDINSTSATKSLIDPSQNKCAPTIPIKKEPGDRGGGFTCVVFPGSPRYETLVQTYRQTVSAKRISKASVEAANYLLHRERISKAARVVVGMRW